MRRTALAIALAIALSGCTSSRQATTARSPKTTASTVPPTTATTVPGECRVPARALPDPERPRYVLHVDVRPAERKVVGDVTVRFTPDMATDRLVFRLWPNGPRLAAAGAHLAVGEVEVGAHPAAPTQPDPTTLVVAGPIGAGQTIEARLTWALTLPKANNDRISQSGDSIRLGSFFPILPWEPGVGWATEPPVSGFAETSTAPVADFDMSVTVPAGLTVLASGEPDAAGARWHAEAVRDVALSIGRFRLAHRQVGGVAVTVGVAPGLPDSADGLAAKIAAKLGDFATWFGAYPWSTYAMAVTPELRGGIEYPTHVMQGTGTIGRTTSHELAHQWFYGLVGDNQGRDPWLDEGLANYAEARAENATAQIVTTPIPIDGRGHLTSSMAYWTAHQSSYYRGVYVQGAQALLALGPIDRVDCALRIYVARNAYRIARPADLVAAAQEVVDGAPAKLAAFGVTSTP